MTRRGTARAGRGQSYLADAEKRTALERHAVRMATELYRAIGAIEVEELGKPYYLQVILDGIERHVEVKGSVGEELKSVQITQGEVDHARTYQPTDPFVVDGISASRGPDGAVMTSGGAVRIWWDWMPSESALRPTHLRYTRPASWGTRLEIVDDAAVVVARVLQSLVPDLDERILRVEFLLEATFVGAQGLVPSRAHDAKRGGNAPAAL